MKTFLLGICLVLICCAQIAAETPKLSYDAPVTSMSKWDDLDKNKKEGFKFDDVEMVIHRCTMGATGTDPVYAPRKAQMQDLHMHWGAYMFARVDYNAPLETPRNQAVHFINTVSLYKTSTEDRVVLCVDWGKYAKHTYYASPGNVAAICENIHALTGVWPVLFVDIDLLNAVLKQSTGWEKAVDKKTSDHISNVFSHCSLWIRNTGKNASLSVTLPDNAPWKYWTFYFFTTKDNPATAKRLKNGNVYPADLSYFYRKRGKQLDSWVKAHSWDYTRAFK